MAGSGCRGCTCWWRRGCEEAVVAEKGPQDVDAAAGDRISARLQLLAVRAISGMRTSGSLKPLIGRIAPRPVLLIASGAPGEIPVNREYRGHGGAQLWEIPEAPHIGGLRTRPAQYERRVTAFLDEALAP